MSNYTLPSAGSHTIPLEVAEVMTARYRANLDTILATEYQNSGILCYSETFNLTDINALVQQTGAAGIRVYYGMREDLSVHAILVAVDQDGKDIVRMGPPGNGEDDGEIVEDAQRCPPTCTMPSSPLNS